MRILEEFWYGNIEPMEYSYQSACCSRTASVWEQK